MYGRVDLIEITFKLSTVLSPTLLFPVHLILLIRLMLLDIIGPKSQFFLFGPMYIWCQFGNGAVSDQGDITVHIGAKVIFLCLHFKYIYFEVNFIILG